jgi:sugar lactone lactonase YvrE
MKLFFVLTVLLSFLERAFSDEITPVVSTKFSGAISPAGLWSDANGNIYGCETSFHSVFKVTSGGVKTDFAGTRGTAGVASEGVLAVNALFNSPLAVWGDGQFLYVTDSANNRIRRVSWSTSLVSTVVGGGTGSILNSGSFPGTSVALTLPNAIAGSSNGKVYFADFDHVYVLNTETGLVGMVSFIAGGGGRIGTFAHGAQVSMKDIQGLAVDPTNNNILFVADSGNKVVRKMNLATGHSIIFAGRVKKENFDFLAKPFEDGEKAYKVNLGSPSSVWVGGDGKVFIADSFYHTISVVRHDKIFLFAGKWQSGAISNTLMTGSANQVQIEASHIFGDSSKGVLYLSDGTRGGIQQISPLTAEMYYKSVAPTVSPTKNPTEAPTNQPNAEPTFVPSLAPVLTTPVPTYVPTGPFPIISRTSLEGGTYLGGAAGVWVDANGNIYAANNEGNKIFKQAPDGTVTLFAGDGTKANTGDGGLATAASLYNPKGIWGDSNNLYVTVSGNRLVRAINFSTKIITTIAGGSTAIPPPATIGKDAVTATAVVFNKDPRSLWCDGKGNLYIMTQNQVFLYVISQQTIQLIAYSDTGAQLSGDDLQPVKSLDLKQVSNMEQMTGDAARNCLYVTEQTAIIRKLDLNTGFATIFAGQYGQMGTTQYTDGVLATSIKFSGFALFGLWAANDGTVFVGDAATNSISAINPYTNTINWFAGTWGNGGQMGLLDADDNTNSLQMNGNAREGKIFPTFLTGDSQTNKLYLLDPVHKGVRVISPLFTSPAPPTRSPTERPTPSPTYSAQPSYAPTAPLGPQIDKTSVDDSTIHSSSGVWSDASGNLFVADIDQSLIYKQSPTGAVSTFAGTTQGNSGDNGLATAAQINLPRGIWGDSDNLYIGDTDNNLIRAVNFGTNIITTIIGGGGATIDGTARLGTTVSLNNPRAIWGDARGNVYILTKKQVLVYTKSDQKVKVLTYSSAGTVDGSAGGEVSFAQLKQANSMTHMAGDATRDLIYVAEQPSAGCAIVRRLDLLNSKAVIFAGSYSTLGSTTQFTDGVLATSIVFSGVVVPFITQGPGLWVASDSTVYVSDYGTNSISTIHPDTNAITWFAGTWNDGGQAGLLASLDTRGENTLHMGGPPKLGKMFPTHLAGNSALNTLYVVDIGHTAVRKITPLAVTPTGRRKLEENLLSLEQSGLQLPKSFGHLRGSV